MTLSKTEQEVQGLTAKDGAPHLEQAPSLAATQIKPVKLVTELGVAEQDDAVATEVAVALIFNGISHVVMMASPGDLEALARGFSLSEGIITHVRDIQDIDCSYQPLGIEVNITVNSRVMSQLKQQRRNMTGRTGCGLCGAESLQQAMRSVNTTSRGKAPNIEFDAIQVAVAQLKQWQPLQQQCGAVHGAAWCNSSGEILLVKEDVGRHNALDKLIGALYAPVHKDDPFDLSQGFALISSRASYEMVSKASRVGMRYVVAVSAPTALAIEVAKQVGLSLVGFARSGRHTIYS
ncbi:MAG: FdhD protein [Paraglaciecola sp.]|jgi:FdhD protein